MESNKEEAIRAREIANRKFLANDISGARKFALKAQFLYPELDGVSQMVATFDVHLSAQNMIHGDIDYYGVLGLNPESDDETVRKRYRKLAMMLHPDRNKSVGAMEAFKFLSQAWGVFSDKAKRADYDQKRRNLGLYEGGGGGGRASSSNNGVQKATKPSVNSAKAKGSKRGVKRASDAPPAPAITSDGTFWTVCRTCRTQYEYHRMYLNQNLLCPNCRKPFIAVETDPPGSGSIRKTFHEHQFDANRHMTEGRKRSVNGEYDPFDWSGGVFAATKPRKDEVVRREYTKRAAGGVSSTNAAKRRKGMENSAANVGNSFAAKSKDFSEEELRNVLKKKAKPLIIKKLQELSAVTDANIPQMETEDLDRGNAVGSRVPVTVVDVPDPGFCDFDKDRTEKAFSDNQVWAAYDPGDGMPRSYVMIEKVISAEPFKVRMVWLTSSETDNELRSTKWLGLGIPKSCGVFGLGRTEIFKSPYIFSHNVKPVKGKNGEFAVYPRKGDVWALYRNWSREWSYLTGGETIEYDVVEVLEGYTEEYGVSVVPLVKVAGYKSVFHHHLDPKEIRTIQRDEMSRFSHRIPSYLLTGREAADAPKGCIQLDPAATPSHLLKIIEDH